MKGAKTLEQYPLMFMEIAELAEQEKSIGTLSASDEAAAIAMRHHFSRFRAALRLARHPSAAAADDLMVRIREVNGVWTLQFVPRGLWKWEREKRNEARIEQITAPEEQRAIQLEPIDRSEDVFSKFVTGCPPHEWDTTESFCLRCREPYAK